MREQISTMKLEFEEIVLANTELAENLQNHVDLKVAIKDRVCLNDVLFMTSENLPKKSQKNIFAIIVEKIKPPFFLYYTFYTYSRFHDNSNKSEPRLQI